MKFLFYQMAPIARARDAVGRMALGLHDLARERAWRSLLFTERQASFHLGPLSLGPLRRGLIDDIPWGGAHVPAPDVALYHHSIGSVVADRFLAWPARRKVLLYQNITPADSPDITATQRDALRWGREQLPRLVRESDLQLGCSAFNCHELRECGAANVVQLPYFLWRRDLRPQVARRAGPPLVLVVGRVVPHKRVLDAIESFRLLRVRFPDARLAVVGNLKGDPGYIATLRRYLSTHDLEAHVTLTGRVSDRRLCAYYRRASALLVLSDHEGFCVPLVEAMRAAVPIVAFAAGAVPETLGTGGLLLDRREPEVVAAALTRVLGEEALVDKLRRAQAKETLRFTREAFARAFDALRLAHV